MPVKIDLNFSGSNQGFILNYDDYNPDNVLVSANYYNIDDLDFTCFSSNTICDIGLTGTDNGLVECMSGQSIQYTMGLMSDVDKFDRLKFDRRFKMFQTTGYTWSPNQRFSGLTDGVDYEIVSKNSGDVGIYHELYGGFYQGFYKLFGYDYEVLPTRYPKGWTVEMTLKPRFVDQYVPQPGHTTLNEFYPDNSGIFFYMGTRAENKYWHWANGTNSGDTSYVRVTEPLTGLSSCMCTTLNPGYTTESMSEIDIRSSGATIIIGQNLSWSPGDDILAFHQELEYVTGTVINYTANTGTLEFQINKSVGVGTFSIWRVDKPDYLEYAESNCVLVYPKSGVTSGHSITICSCCVPPPPPPIPEHDPLFDSMSNALAIRFSGDPANPKICVRTLTFTGDCATTGSCETIGNTTMTGYSINNYCSPRGIYDDCLGTDYFDKEHWVLIDAVFERYSWFDFCDLYYRGGLGTISTTLYTATTNNTSVTLIQPPLTHEQLRAKREEYVQLNYQWLIEEFYRRGKLKIYVNGKHFFTIDNFEEIIPRGLWGHKETQVGVPFNLSWGGGTQGLHDNLVFSGMPESFCEPYIQDPELFPDSVLSGTSLSGLSTNILLEKYFGGTFDGGISTFHMYAKPLSVPEIQHNARILYDKYDLLNPYCLDCLVVDNCDFEYEFTGLTPTPTASITPSITPSSTEFTATPTPTPTHTPTNTLTPFASPSQTATVTPSVSPTKTPFASSTPTPSTTSPYFEDCLILQWEGPTYYLPPIGIINGKPYFEASTPFNIYPFRIYFDSTSNQWKWINLITSQEIGYMNYTGNYPDSNIANWVWVGTYGSYGVFTEQGNCSQPPPQTPTPTQTQLCCETHELYWGFPPISPGITLDIVYDDCNGDEQSYQINLDNPGPLYICARSGTIRELFVDINQYLVINPQGNCDCNLGTTPTPTPSVTGTNPQPSNSPTRTPTQTPTNTKTPTPTPTYTPTKTVTPSITPTITQTSTCCNTWELYSMSGGNFEVVDCEGITYTLTLGIGGTQTVCAKNITISPSCVSCNAYISTNCECCTPVENTTITNTVLDTPAIDSYSRGTVSVGLSSVGGGIYNISGAASKSTANLTVSGGGNLGGYDNCLEGAVEVTAFVPSSPSGPNGYRTKITVYHNNILLGTVYSGYNPSGSNVTQIFTFTRSSGDNIHIEWDSET